jgi:hypothetical protein
MELTIQEPTNTDPTGLCFDFTYRDLPTELMIKILEFWTLEDFKKCYFSCKDLKPILDYLIKKNNLSFIGKFDMILEEIVFQYYARAFILCHEKFGLYDGFIENMYKNQELSIDIWEEKCEKYDFVLPYMPKVLGFVFKEHQINYDEGNFKKKQNHYDITIYQSLFMSKLINYLNH